MTDKFIKKTYVRHMDKDGYRLLNPEITIESQPIEERKIYYFVYDADFFAKYPERCKKILEKGDLSHEKYMEKCLELGVIPTTATDTVACEVTEIREYVPFSEEAFAQAKAEHFVCPKVTVEEFKTFLKSRLKKAFSTLINSKSPFKTSDGAVIDFSLSHINALRNLIAVTEGEISFRVYDNTFTTATVETLEKWLKEMIDHMKVLTEIKWDIEDDINKSLTYQELINHMESMGAVWDIC